jgi:hypothetical protein
MQPSDAQEASTVQQPSAAIRKWLASGAGQGRPTSLGGPLRRRRTIRHLEALSEATALEAHPRSAVTHVHVLKVPDNPDAIVNQAEATTEALQG